MVSIIGGATTLFLASKAQFSDILSKKIFGTKIDYNGIFRIMCHFGK